MRLSRILQLRPPKWDAVKRQFDKNKDTTYGKVFAAITGVTAFGVAAAFILWVGLFVLVAERRMVLQLLVAIPK